MNTHGLGRIGKRALAAGVVAALGLGGEARGADEGAVLLLQAEQLATEGRCADALPVVRQARQLDPDSARAGLLEGECVIREQRYDEAIAPLEDARRLDPELARATLYLGIAHYQLGDFAAAERELERAATLLPDSAEVHLYRALVLLERADAAAAAAALEQARSLDPGTVDPAASYFAGRAWQVAKEREKAEQALQRVIEQHPGTPWAEEAGRALQGASGRVQRRGAWARLSAGMEYDDNVVLRGAGVVLPTDISDEDGGRGVWYARTGVEFLRGSKWASGVLSGYYGNAHIDGFLRDFDTHYPNVAVWVDRLIGESTYLRLQPDFAYAWVDYDDFLLENGVTLSAHHAYEDVGRGRFFFRFEHRDYRFQLFAPRDNRDGLDYIGGYDHAYDLTEGTELRANVGANYYDSENGEYTHVAPRVGVGARQELPFDLTFDLDFRYRHEFYENVSAFSPPNLRTKRRDDVYFLSVLLERPISERIKVSARYRFENDDSNVSSLKGNACCTRPFDYDRNVVGAFVTYDFEPE